MLLLALALLAGCTGSPGEPAVPVPEEGPCPYNGAMAEAYYETPLDPVAVVKLWTDLGWKRANPEYPVDGPSQVALVEGSFEGSGWVVVMAEQMGSGTRLTAWVNQSQGDRKAHPKQAARASKLLDQFRLPLEQKLEVKAIKVETRVHWGCIVD